MLREIRAPEGHLARARAVGVEVEALVDRFDMLTDEEIKRLGGLVRQIGYFERPFQPAAQAIAVFRLVALTPRQAWAQYERLNAAGWCEQLALSALRLAEEIDSPRPNPLRLVPQEGV